MVFGQIAGSLAGRGHLKAAASGPVNVLADKSWLVTPGQAVNDPGVFGLLCEQWACQHIGFHIHHDNVMTRPNGGLAVTNAGMRDAGSFHNDIDALITDKSDGILSEEGPPAIDCRINANGCSLRFRPSGTLEVCTRSDKIQVGNPDNVDTRRGPCLGEIHRGEFPAADNGNADRLVPGLTFL